MICRKPASRNRRVAAAWTARSASRPLACGAIAGPVFLAISGIAGHKRAGYDARRHPVSSLALGPGGLVQRANFIITGSLYLAGSVGLARTGRSRFVSPPGPIMIGAAGIGLIGSGIFNTDPVSGYPPGTAAQPTPPTQTDVLHNLCAIPIFVGIPATALRSAGSAMRTGETAWAVYSYVTAAVMVGTAALFGQAFAQKPSLVASGGLLQRISITSGFAWLTALHTAAANTPSG
jgi:Protein of unknown function (DUF998)